MEDPSFWAEPRTWVVIAFILFFLIFGKYLWRAIAAMLDGHAASIRAELEEASRLRREAEVMLADARQRRETALKDAQALIDGARAEAERVAKSAEADARAAASRREQMAIDRIAAAEKAAVHEVRVAAADVATAAARSVIAEELSSDADAPLIERSITHLPAALRAA